MYYEEIGGAREGAVLAQDMYGNAGALLFKKGHILTADDITELDSLGFAHLPIHTEDTSDIRPKRLISAKTEQLIISSLRMLDIMTVYCGAETIVAELIANDVTTCDHVPLKTFDDYTFQHSVAVGVYVAIVGINAGFSVMEVIDLCAAGLLHDIGKIILDAALIDAPRRLTFDEFEIVKRHSEAGYNLLKNARGCGIPSCVRRAVLQHHENEDSTGYPNRPDGSTLHKFSKILHICDVFDALTSRRAYKDAWPIPSALAYIESHTNDMFSKKYTRIFLSCVPPYPVGSTIHFSDGKSGIVTSANPDNINDPVLRLKKKGQELLLSEISSPIITKNVPDQKVKDA